MAARSNELTELLNLRIDGDFKPYAYYGEEEDSLTIRLKGDADYARRLNSRVTVFFSEDTGELVGCQIKSVRHVLEDIGWFDVKIQHGKVRLDLLFLACRAEFGCDKDARQYFRDLGAEVKRNRIEAEIPQSCAC